jgi:hypothetical protein
VHCSKRYLVQIDRFCLHQIVPQLVVDAIKVVTLLYHVDLMHSTEHVSLVWDFDGEQGLGILNNLATGVGLEAVSVSVRRVLILVENHIYLLLCRRFSGLLHPLILKCELLASVLGVFCGFLGSVWS